MQAGLQRALSDALDVLERLGLSYALVGGLAVSAWAIPRATRDADLWVELEGRMDELERELGAGGFDTPAMRAELERFGVFRSKHLATGVFVDMFNAVGPLGEEILRRRRAADLDGRMTWLASPEDVAVLKAFSDRSRDMDDLIQLVKLDSLDLEYVKRWCERLDSSIESNEIVERLERALDRARRER